MIEGELLCGVGDIDAREGAIQRATQKTNGVDLAIDRGGRERKAEFAHQSVLAVPGGFELTTAALEGGLAEGECRGGSKDCKKKP